MDVFVIEDSEDDLFAIKRCLRGGEFDFHHCTSLRGFREQWAATPCDVILCDLNIDESYGIATFLAVKEISTGTPIIVLSGHEEDDLAIEAIQKGAQDYLNKNRIDKKRLKVTIEFAIERQRSREELTKARERIEQELAFRSNFLAHFSHSIRTPLHGLGSMLDLMNYNPGAFKSSEILDNLYYSYARLRQTVEDLLDFEASFGQGFCLDKTKSTPRELVHLSLNFLRPLLVGGFRVFGSAPDHTTLNIDIQKVSKAICRVVLNSVKHSGSCHATLSCYLDNQALKIHIRDNGKGLPKDWGDGQSPFSRGDFSTVSQGAGLGLYLVHESLSLMGAGF
ncbi:hybrid sensor histidine kinase/response regulator [Pseudobacteriovorax antillogorgiicola]|uniref:histidine kinase n=1 Tax=Pseudobacteriovorax antillogorgiicola TaxID=1513793 RepID=A0A1Y6BFE4_9BACT|nr:response regulator [Pseudobacteriovorax antillogorgiicola]TCS57430.1 phospho-acceptor domain-containing protein [Pseudobacteriovorax antillogorgiicola]SMF01204.1 His Kinase A (phospho-acceptor) domain-containing protein [Pseudobacteriovorax antillogorgiicola]